MNMSSLAPHIARDRRLRRAILQSLHRARANESGGWISGRFLFDVLGYSCPSSAGPESDSHLLALLRDLVAKKLVEERDDRDRRSQSFSLDRLSFRVMAMGSSLCEETIPPDPDIDDERILRRS